MSLIELIKLWFASKDLPVPASDEPPPSSILTSWPLLGHPSLNNAAYWKRSEDPTPRLVIFSGAGLSVESGLSTFRGSDGLWNNHPIDQVCNGNNWRAMKGVVEAFYGQRIIEATSASPHEGHRWCADLENKGAVLLTQNVDILFEQAGALHVGHLHGRLDHRQCFGCDYHWQVPPLKQSGTCPRCGSEDTRVDVVFFNEHAPAYQSAYRVLGGLHPQDVLLIVGTTAQVFNPVLALTTRAQVWIVDPNPPRHLVDLPGVRVWEAPASALPQTAGVAWEELLALSRQ